DEFQNFVGPDLEFALPEVRQLGLRLILSHQGLWQLLQGDTNLLDPVFQAKSRLIFGIESKDADELGHLLASLTFDPHRIKHEIYTRHQRVAGQRIIELSSWTESHSKARAWNETWGRDWSERQSIARDLETRRETLT